MWVESPFFQVAIYEPLPADSEVVVTNDSDDAAEQLSSLDKFKQRWADFLNLECRRSKQIPHRFESVAMSLDWKQRQHFVES